MLKNTHLNLAQSINSLMAPIGLSLSSRKEIITKTTMLALAAILLIDDNFLNLPLASANEAFKDCIALNCTQPDFRERGYCIRSCFGLLH